MFKFYANNFKFCAVKKNYKDCDALCFLWRDKYVDPRKDYYMNVHLFDKVDSPCIVNWTIKKTAAGQSESFDLISIRAMEGGFYMDNFLSSFHEISVAIKVYLDVINILEEVFSDLLNLFQTIVQYFKLYQRTMSLKT